jgi:hypothetical protein
VLQATFQRLQHSHTGWALIGSAAAALHGCHVTPRDLDFLTVEPKGVYRFAQGMGPWTPPKMARLADGQEWFSTAEMPVESSVDDWGFHWHFARWLVDGLKVEVAHLRAPAGFPMADDRAGIWEAGPEIWPYVHTVSFAGFAVPVVPLEIQLQTAFQRGMDERAAEIVATLGRRGSDEALLERALAAEHLARFRRMSGEPAAA